MKKSCPEKEGHPQAESTEKILDPFARANSTRTYSQGATKTVSTCPRQVVLASGQVGCQSYLSFGQVNESQKIIF